MLALAASGCGSADPGIVPVAGKLTFSGRELPGVCRLTFVPTADGDSGVRPSGGEMTPNGTYELTEFRGVRGLYPGSYRVRLAYYDLRPGGNPDVEGDWKETSYEAPDLLVIEAGSAAVQYDLTVPAG